MKIVDIDIELALLTKEDTEVGQVYMLHESKKKIFFRCQGGFVNLLGGAYTAYESVRNDACWQHFPDATVKMRG